MDKVTPITSIEMALNLLYKNTPQYSSVEENNITGDGSFDNLLQEEIQKLKEEKRS